MGSIFPCFYTRKSKIETPQKILVEKWAAFPPVVNRKFKDQKSAKNGQHVPLFLQESFKDRNTAKKSRRKMGSISPSYYKKDYKIKALQ